MPPNYQNGYSQKTVKPQLDEIDIKVPRDRHGNYEPKIISKYGRNVEGMEDKILSLYACGMSQRDIAEQIKGNGFHYEDDIESNRRSLCPCPRPADRPVLVPL